MRPAFAAFRHLPGRKHHAFDGVVAEYLHAKEALLINPIANIAGKLVDKATAPKYYFTDNGRLNLFLLYRNTFNLQPFNPSDI